MFTGLIKVVVVMTKYVLTLVERTGPDHTGCYKIPTSGKKGPRTPIREVPVVY
jgi:hypothetical protein